MVEFVLAHLPLANSTAYMAFGHLLPAKHF